MQLYDWDHRIARAVCMAESSGNPNATNTANADGSGDRGLMQINSVHADLVGGNLDALYDPATNVRIAYQLYQSAGWRPWMAYTTGKYAKYL